MTTETKTVNLKTRLMLRNVRLAFPHLWEPQVSDTGVKTFGAAFLLPTNHPQIKEIQACMDEAGRAKWGDKWPAQKKALEKQDRMALHDGDIKAKYDGYEGNLFINANAKARPLVIDTDKSALTEDDGRPYAGCYVNVSLEFWPQKDHPKGGSRINASLRGVQFLRDGDAFSAGRPADADEFEAVEGGDADDFA